MKSGILDRIWACCPLFCEGFTIFGFAVLLKGAVDTRNGELLEGTEKCFFCS